MIDRREQILARLRALIGDIAGPVKTVRNGDELSGQSRPAIFLHDGVEERVDTGQGGAPNSQTQLMRMHPQIALLMGAPTEEIGPAMSEFRRLVLVAVLNDATLVGMVGVGGRKPAMWLESCAVTTESGETREGRMDMVFTFDYPFKISELS
jgi:hypothetical protein